jgi:hypothetical protein
MQITGALIGFTAVVLAGVAVLIPIAGLTARVALRPIVDALARYRELQGRDENVLLLERRMQLMEEHIQSIDRSVQVLVEDADFRRRLEATSPVQAASLPPAGRGSAS